MLSSFAPTPHEEAAALIADKPPVSREVFDQLLPELRGRAFTITGVTAADVMERVRDAIAALPRGTVWDDAKSDIVKELDPWLGDASEQRAELLLRTHGFQAFQASNWRVAQEDDDTTHLQYLATEDSHVRPTHIALNGIVLPKDDPFWEKHYPPWEWGCRCRTRPMNPDLVAEARAEDQQRIPENRLVLEGAQKQQLEDGHLLRGPITLPDGSQIPGRQYTVTAPSDQSGDDHAFQWHPDNLRLPLADLKARYDPADWKVFEDYAQRTEISPGLTVMQWLRQTPSVPSVLPKPAPPPPPHPAILSLAKNDELTK